MKNYIESEVVRSLSKKSDISISQGQKQIVENWGPSAKGDVGIKSKGKINFLVNYCGYVHSFKKSK